MSSQDCAFLDTILRTLNSQYSETLPCCQRDMVTCDANLNIIELDLSKFEITKEMSFPYTIEFLSHIKKFSLKGQKNIKEIVQFNAGDLEILNLSGSGINSANFPRWINDAPKLKELYLTNTKISGVPLSSFKSTNLEKCSITNTPICSIYQSQSQYYDFLPEKCKASCSDKVSPNEVDEESSSSSSSSSWPYILGVGVLLIIVLLIAGYFFMKNRKNKNNNNSYSKYNNNNPKPMLPISKKSKSNNVISNRQPEEQIININSRSQIMEEVARTNYSNAYGADVTHQSIDYEKNSYASVKDIYRQHNASTNSFNNAANHPQQYNSMYDTMNNQEDSLNNIQEEEIINNEIIGVPEAAVVAGTTGILAMKEKVAKGEEPILLRRKASKKSHNSKPKSVNSNASDAAMIVEDDKNELYIANWDYNPTLSDELTLIAGDIIEIKKIFDDGWSTGFNRRTQQSGIIPMCYLIPFEN